MADRPTPTLTGGMRRTARIGLTGAALIALAGCSIFRGGDGPKTPTVGERVSILSNDASVRPDPTIAAQEVLLPPQFANADWAQSGGGPTKAPGHVALPASRSPVWSAQIAGSSRSARLAAAPVIADGRLYAIGTDAVVHAMDAATGAPAWTTGIGTTGDGLGRAVFGGGVAVDAGVVYATSGVGDVAALDAATGAVRWRVRPTGPLRGAPTVAFGQVYVVGQDNQLFALDAADGAVLWQESATLQAGSVFGAASPAAGQGTIVAGFSSGEIQAYRYENGRALWDDALARTSIALSVATLTDVDADPVIDRGRVFALGQGGRMASYELLTGQRLWELSIAGISTPWVAGEWVFVVTDDARLLCVARATGRVRWMTQLPRYRIETEKKKKDPIRWTGPVLAGGRLLLVNTQGQLAEVDPADGAVASTIAIGGAITQPPVVANGTLYLLEDGGRLTAWR